MVTSSLELERVRTEVEKREFPASPCPLPRLEMGAADGHLRSSWRGVLGKGLETGRQGLVFP